jgi:hypothetical protein
LTALTSWIETAHRASSPWGLETAGKEILILSSPPKAGVSKDGGKRPVNASST